MTSNPIPDSTLRIDAELSLDGVILSAGAAPGYAGDVSPQLAFEWWQAGQAALVDVRSDAERAWVGFMPAALAVAWKQWPGMVMNAHVEEDLVLLLCRSGVRPVAAAQRGRKGGWRFHGLPRRQD